MFGFFKRNRGVQRQREIILEEHAYDRFSPFTGKLYRTQAERDADPVHQARLKQYELDHAYPSEGGNW